MQPSSRAASPESRKVENLRALACLLLVAFHVGGASIEFGYHLADDSFWRRLLELTRPARMPLFTFLSGYVYAMRPLRGAGGTASFLSRKAQRLLWPFVILTPVFVVGQHLSSGQWTRATFYDVLRNWIVPQTHYWFLPALLLMFGAVAALERVGALKTPARLAAIVVVLTLANLAQPVSPNLFGIGHAMVYLPCMLAGIAVRRFPAMAQSNTAIALGLLAYAAYLPYGMGRIAVGDGVLAVLLIVSGCGLCLLFFRFGPARDIGARFGLSSFAVFLYHQYFVTLVRWLHLPVPTGIEFVLLMLAGIGGPVLLERLMLHSPWAAYFLLGRARTPRRPSPEPAVAAAPRAGEGPA